MHAEDEFHADIGRATGPGDDIDVCDLIESFQAILALPAQPTFHIWQDLVLGDDGDMSLGQEAGRAMTTWPADDYQRSCGGKGGIRTSQPK